MPAPDVISGCIREQMFMLNSILLITFIDFSQNYRVITGKSGAKEGDAGSCDKDTGKDKETVRDLVEPWC